MKKIIITFLLLLLFALPVSAEDNIYSNQLENSGAKELEELLPDGAEDILDDLEIDITDPDMADKITLKSIFSVLWDFIKS